MAIGQPAAALASENTSLKRSEADAKYKWDLTDIYPNQDAFTADLARIKNDLIPQFANYKGKLTTTESIKAVLELRDETKIILDKAWLYSDLGLSLNQTDSEAQCLSMQYDSLNTEFLSATSYIATELMALSPAQLNEIINAPELSVYKIYLETLLQQRDHVLSVAEEALLSKTSELSGSPYNIFESLMYGDYQYGTINNENGQEINLTPTSMSNIMKKGDRELREKAYEEFNTTLGSYNNTFGTIYASHVKNDVFYAKVRNYDSSLQASLANDNIPESIYYNLIETVDNNMQVLHDYYRLRKQVSGYDELYPYDLSVPLVQDPKTEISYDQAVQIVRKALQPLGENYIAKYDEGIANRWIDVYPDDHKYTGGFADSVYGVHPYILLNYVGSQRSVSTLAHEMGHAINFVETENSQEYANSGLPIFTAEVASTLNERLLMDYLIQNAESDQEKTYLLENHLANLENTFFGQVSFAKFEQETHEMVESGQALTPQALNDLYLSNSKNYYGDSINLESSKGFGWSTVPHFYDSFYVYNYATSIAAAHALADKILTGDKNALKNYLDFLKAGTSDYPVEILKKAGVDMTSPEPIESFIEYYGQLVDELKTLLAKQTAVQDTQSSQDSAPTNLTYTIQPGDVLWRIAQKYGLTWQKLAEINNLENPNLIIPGNQLVISK